MFARRRDKKGTWPRALLSLAFSIAIVMGIRWAFFEPYIIPSESMVPTLLVHDHIMVNKFAYGLRVPFTQKWLHKFSDPKRGDIIVFRSVDDPQVFLIKRVIGLPGDKIEIAGQTVRINGKNLRLRPMNENQVSPYLIRENTARNLSSSYQFKLEGFDSMEHVVIFRDTNDEIAKHEFDYQSHESDEQQKLGVSTYEVPADHYFMMGDNRDNSSDSRMWGSVPHENILGRASMIWLSCEEMAENSSRLCNFSTLRSERIFSKVH